MPAQREMEGYCQLIMLLSTPPKKKSLKITKDKYEWIVNLFSNYTSF